MAVLGSLLVDPSLLPRVVATLRPPDFYASLHESIFTAIFAVYERAEPLDKITLAQELRDHGMYEKVGGMAYLNSLMDAVPSAGSVHAYAKIVTECSSLRGLIHASSRLAQLGFESAAEEAEDALTQGLATVQELVDRSLPTSRRPLGLVAASLELEAHFATGRGTAYPTPYRKLDDAIGGWIPGTLNVIGGSPKMGKSYFAQTVASHLAATTRKRVPFYALELGRKEQQLRLEQMYSCVSSLKRIKGIRLTEDEVERIDAARLIFASQDIQLFDGFPQFGTQEIIVSCRRLASDCDLAGVFIDHIGFLRDVRSHGRDTKHDRIENALSLLLEMSRALAVPVFIVWHVNRQAKDGEPTIFDLRDGGNVEGYAHNIFFVHREHWDMADGSQRDGKIIIAAARSGKAGTLKAYFDDERGVWCASDRRAFFDAPAPDQPGLLEYAHDRLARTETTPADVDGQPARIVVPARCSDDEDRAALNETYGAP